MVFESCLQIWNAIFVSFLKEFLGNQTVPEAGEGWFDGKEAINEEREANGLDYNSSYGE